jgi:hypothetical protein
MNQAIQVGNDVGESVGHHKMSHSAGQEAGEAAGQQAFKDCYRPKIQNFFNSFSDPSGSLRGKSIPTPGSPQSKNEELKGQQKSWYLADLPTSSFSTFFLFGTVRTRKKKKKAVKSSAKGISAKKVFLFVLINLLLLYSLSYFGWGCGCGGGGDDTNAPTMVSICTQTDPVDVSTLNPPPQKVQDCCDPANQYQTMLSDVASNPQKCMECNSYCAPNAATAAAAALSAGQAEAGNMAAQKLQSVPQGTTPSGIPSPYVANQNAALAGDEGAGQSALNGKSTSGLGNTGLPSSGGGGSGGGLGNSGKGLGGYASGGGLTPPVPTSSPSGAALLGNSGGTYSSGGSGSTRSSRTGFGFDRSTAGVSGSGTANTMTFGETAESSNSLQGSDDPADYFTRIGLDKSIFKIVHDRYQAKSRAWIRSSLK